jgi:Sec-independent protein translocase protein TatA
MIASATAFISPGSGEFLLIMLVLILLFGAKDAPRIFRSIHQALDKLQRAAASFRYKIMYSDLYSDRSEEPPYDVQEEDSSTRKETPADTNESGEPGDDNPQSGEREQSL